MDAIWFNRGVSHYAIGRSLMEDCSVARGGVTPESFEAEIDARFDLSGARVIVANSHAWGTTAAWSSYHEDGETGTIWNFDAHHDLGYDEGVEEHHEKGVNDCADWAYQVLRDCVKNPLGEPADKYRVVYPDWQGYREIRDDKLPREAHPEFRYDWWNPIGDHFEFTTWGEFLVQPPVPMNEEIGTVLLCRSSSWTPPWEDHRFEELVGRMAVLANLERNEVECWDCDPPGGKRISGYDACTPREFDAEAWQKYVVESYEAADGRK